MADMDGGRAAAARWGSNCKKGKGNERMRREAGVAAAYKTGKGTTVFPLTLLTQICGA
jgi:hypothetical protein